MRLDSLTALRFPAAVAVFAVHATVARKSGPVHRLFGQGSVGVSFFFILSGFVLAWSRRPDDSVRSFYRRRFARVWPSHAATWIVAGLVIVIGSGAFSPTGSLLSLALVQPWIPKQSVYYAMDAPSWSLGCEAFFYLLFPFIIGPLTDAPPRRRWTIVAAAALIIVILPVLLQPRDRSIAFWFIYIFPPVRLLEFVIGMVLALELKRGWRPRVTVLSAAGLTVVAYLAAGFLPFGLALVAATLLPFALLICAAAVVDLEGRGSFLRHPVLVRLGVLSFAFYLVHTLALTLLDHFLALNLVLLAGVGFVLALAGSVLLHVLVERPAERGLRGAAPARAKG